MSNEAKSFKAGDRVKIVALPEYIKTAEPMPMLRPPSLLNVGELGTILDRRPGGLLWHSFYSGSFFIGKSVSRSDR